MTSCKLEQVGDRLALMLDQDAAKALNIHPGDTVQLEIVADGVLRVDSQTWADDPHARARAFLKRYRRAFTQLG